jgi:hypothetical protein
MLYKHLIIIYLLLACGEAPDLSARLDGVPKYVSCAAAAKWRKFVDLIRHRVREVHEECLSFVIPQQQGKPVAGHGVVR